MTDQIYPCLWFDGQAKEAADFYCSIFKNSKINAENPMVVNFELNGTKLMGLNGGPMFKINPSISVFVLCETLKDTDETWNKLLDGGTVLMPLDKYPWSEKYGWLQDKFGLTWQVSIVNEEGDKQQLTPSMLFTNNQFGKAEQAVKFYTSVFDNSSVDVMILYPEGDPNAGKVMYSEFNLNNYKLIAMDGPGEHSYTFNEAVSFVLGCETQSEIDYYWEKLTEGGEEAQCGWLKDQFGVSWQVIPSILGQLMSNPETAQKAAQAFMQMKKFEIAKLL